MVWRTLSLMWCKAVFIRECVGDLRNALSHALLASFFELESVVCKPRKRSVREWSHMRKKTNVYTLN